jgi:hypothetical protein
MRLNEDIMWILYSILAGLLTYYVFETDILYIFFAVVSIELSYFLIYRTKWNFIKRYLINLFYISGYVIPLALS